VDFRQWKKSIEKENRRTLEDSKGVPARVYALIVPENRQNGKLQRLSHRFRGDLAVRLDVAKCRFVVEISCIVGTLGCNSHLSWLTNLQKTAASRTRILRRRDPSCDMIHDRVDTGFH